MNRNQELAGPLIMLLSAAIFGFFGFVYGIDWNTPGVDGHPVVFRVLMGWTLKLSAVVMAAAAGLTLLHPAFGNLLYAIAGIVSAGLFVVVAVLDATDTQHGIMPYAPVILLFFAAWNGYGSWTSLRALAGRPRGGGPGGGGPAPGA